MSIFQPTYLYIKQHSITNLLYFGKTIREPLKYNGSGTYWNRHIKKHGKEHIETLWYCLFLDKDSINKFAENFSIKNNIVESKNWANMKPENGLDGGQNLFGLDNPMKDIKNREKLSLALKGKYVGELHPGYGKKRPDHSKYMKSIEFGKHKTAEQIKNHKKSWIESTKDNPIRSKEWTIYFNGEIFKIKNLKKFCFEKNISYLRIYNGKEIDGYKLAINNG